MGVKNSGFSGFSGFSIRDFHRNRRFWTVSDAVWSTSRAVRCDPGVKKSGLSGFCGSCRRKTIIFFVFPPVRCDLVENHTKSRCPSGTLRFWGSKTADFLDFLDSPSGIFTEIDDSEQFRTQFGALPERYAAILWSKRAGFLDLVYTSGTRLNRDWLRRVRRRREAAAHAVAGWPAGGQPGWLGLAAGRLGSLGWLGEARPGRPGGARPAQVARPESRSPSQPDGKRKDGSRAGSPAGRLGEARPGRPGRAQPSPAQPAPPATCAEFRSGSAGLAEWSSTLLQQRCWDGPGFEPRVRDLGTNPGPRSRRAAGSRPRQVPFGACRGRRLFV